MNKYVAHNVQDLELDTLEIIKTRAHRYTAKKKNFKIFRTHKYIVFIVNFSHEIWNKNVRVNPPLFGCRYQSIDVVLHFFTSPLTDSDSVRFKLSRVGPPPTVDNIRGDTVQ